MQIYISHLIETKSMLELVKQYPIGIESIHFSIASILDDKEQELINYKNELEEVLDYKSLGLHGPFFDLSPASFDSEIRKVTMARFESIYEVARELGARHIVFHSGFIPITFYIEGWLGNSITFWKEFMKNKDESVQIYIENVYEEEFWPIRQVIDEVNHPAFSACLDIGHVNAYSSKRLEEWIDGLGDKIRHVHLHNNHGDRDAHLALDKGSIQMKESLMAIKSVAPQATWTVEISNQEQLEQSMQWLRDNEFLDE